MLSSPQPQQLEGAAVSPRTAVTTPAERPSAKGLPKMQSKRLGSATKNI